MQIRQKLFSEILLGLLVFSCILTLHPVLGQTTPNDSIFKVAEDTVNTAFKDVLAAEKAGANVTDLLKQLNGAFDLLAQGNTALRIGDTVTAQSKVQSSIPIAQQVSSSAKIAEHNAAAYGGMSGWLGLVFSIIGLIVFVSVLLLLWGQFKKGYFKKLSDAKPELKQR
jgi:hypothetical protein